MRKKYRILEGGNIQAYRSFGRVKRSRGGKISDERCLSHFGGCWVEKGGAHHIHENIHVFDDKNYSGRVERPKGWPSCHLRPKGSDLKTKGKEGRYYFFNRGRKA